MSSIYKRIILFLSLCIGSRLLLVYISKHSTIEMLQIYGFLALLPALGFLYIYVTGSRKTGLEVFGDKIWWNNLRPMHSVLYFTFAFTAINGYKNAYVFLLIDVIIGLLSFLLHHFT